MARSHAATVKKILKEYADRGVFGGFAEKPAGIRKSAYEFVWLYNRRFRVEHDERAHTVTFKGCLPDVPAKSRMYKRLKEFVASRTDSALRPHRRIDPKRAEPACRVRNDTVSISVKVNNNQYTYATRKLVNLVHETFLMIDHEFTEYLYEHFGLPEE